MSCRALLAIAMLLTGAVSSAPIVAHADGAPMWESPEGLTPGLPNTHVQMTSEDVRVQVQENAGGVYANVAATFDLLNIGPTVQMLVGFPDFTGLVHFDSAKITSFRAWADTTNYSASEQNVRAGQFAGPWFVWSMVFPATKPLHLQVAYHQPLSPGAVSSDLVPVSYVLRTGALWAGPIGHAAITITAPDGGALLPPVSVTLPNGAVRQVLAPTSADSSQLTWSLSNFTPSDDIEARFVRPATWSALQAAEIAANSPNATADELAKGAQLILNTFNRELTGPYGTHYLPLPIDWTRRALEADPSSAGVWEAVGDLANVTAPRSVSFLRCWPAAAADAYQRAADLGSASAASRLADLQLQRDDVGHSLDDCAPPQGLTLPQAARAPLAPVASSDAAQPVPAQGPTSGQSQTVSCQPAPGVSGSDSGWSGSGMVCDDGTQYRLNSDGSLVSRYDASHPEAAMTGGPWPTTAIAMAEWEWVDPELHRACYFFGGVTRSSVPNGNCQPKPDNAADAAVEPLAVAPPPASVAAGAPPSEDAPDTLIASQRADILSAIDRANAAWARASQSLNASDLDGAVAGRELTDDLAELDKLRRQGQTRKNINTAFAVTDVTLDAPGHAIARTRETWSAELYDAATGRLLQRTPSTTYAETYTIEYLHGGWIVTKNDT